MELLGIHVHFELQLCCQWYVFDLEDSDLALISQISLMLPLHLGFFLIPCEFISLVPLQVVLHSLRDDLLHFLLALGRVCYRFLSHHPQVVRHGHPGLRRRHKAKRNLLLLLLLFLEFSLALQFALLLLCQEFIIFCVWSLNMWLDDWK